jgi:hypothetical protein
MPELTFGDIECCLMKTKPWKAAGEDGLPAGVWRQVWPAARKVCAISFKLQSTHESRHNSGRPQKPFRRKKPDKGDYTQTTAWRPISLLSTLGKLL